MVEDHTEFKSLGAIDMDSHKINNVTDPTANQDAATKKYVDDEIAGIPEAPIKKIASGTITVATTTVAYDVDYADINIAVNDLAATDILVIECFMLNASDKPVFVRFDTENVTSTDTGTAFEIAGAGVSGKVKWDAMQDPKVDDIIISNLVVLNNVSMNEAMKTYNCDDADIFTTAFTIRINTKNLTQPANDTSIIRYLAYVIKG